jgi:hypothetical protein
LLAISGVFADDHAVELITHRIRRALEIGAATIPELQADPSLARETIRHLRVAMWVLTSSGYARKAGRIEAHNLYQITADGRLGR